MFKKKSSFLFIFKNVVFLLYYNKSVYENPTQEPLCVLPTVYIHGVRLQGK